MKIKRTHFYGTIEDNIKLLQKFESLVEGGVTYVSCKIRYHEEPVVYKSINCINEIGSSRTGRRELLDSFLIVPEFEEKIVSHQGKDRNGRKFWNTRSTDNKNSAFFLPSSTWDGRILIPGEFYSAYDNSYGDTYFKYLMAAVKQTAFSKFGMYWIGQGAVEFHNSGKRLVVSSEKSPVESDFCLQ